MARVPFAPGDGRTAHRDPFAAAGMPPAALQAPADFAGVPELAAYPDRINAATELLRRAEAVGPQRRAFHFPGAEWSFSELRNRAERIARVLRQDYGVLPGHRVLLRGPNTPMLAACWLAVLKAGGICVATMPLLRSRELAAIAEKAQVSVALCDIRYAGELEAVVAGDAPLAQLHGFTATGAGGTAAADLDTALVNQPGEFLDVETAADDVALIAFTSGTTGTPKAAMHLHRDVLAMCDTFARHVLGGTADDVYTGTPPLGFTFGLGALLCFPLSFGASTAYVEQPSPGSLCDVIERYRCTTLFTAPTMYRALLEELDKRDLSSLEVCVSAGEALPLRTFHAWREATGIDIIDGLGSTEMIHIFLSAARDQIRPGTIGRAVPGYQVRVVDESGKEQPPGVWGHLAVRGPTSCRYLDDPENQRRYVRGGWNFPGDLCSCDADGYISYHGRADDLIVSAGYNISAREVEEALSDHPEVVECAVVGVPDPDRGTIVKAFVVLRDPRTAGETMALALQQFVKSEIAPYKYPRGLEFVTALPKTTTGKVRRSALRDGPPKGPSR